MCKHVSKTVILAWQRGQKRSKYAWRYLRMTPNVHNEFPVFNRVGSERQNKRQNAKIESAEFF